ncbi:MAG: hypothetical protein K9H26_17150 [Prolixibacteraceae bacterium]|nr:hypothetical protein [Prolixibacteraceae bacterium]
METISIKLKNKNALNILKSLEKAQIISLVKKNETTSKNPSSFKGAISKERAIQLSNEINESRNEWEERTI